VQNKKHIDTQGVGGGSGQSCWFKYGGKYSTPYAERITKSCI